MEKTKLNVLLAKTDHLSKPFAASVKDYIHFFKNSASSFRGEKKTYMLEPGVVDDPSMRGDKLIVTTVDEKLSWFTDVNGAYIDALLSQEATNAAGAKADLVVNGQVMANLSTLELLRLKSLLEHGDIEQMYAAIPCRTEDEIWTKTSNEAYNGKDVFEGKLSEGEKKTIFKEAFILPDPNIGELKDSSSYKPMVAQKDTVVKLGVYSHQKFSGEWSHRQRAELLRRRTVLLSAIIEALKKANEVEAVESQMTSKKLFDFLHKGAI